MLKVIETPEEDVGVVEEVDEILPVVGEDRVRKEASRTVQGPLFGEGGCVPENAGFVRLTQNQLPVAVVVQLADGRAVAAQLLLEFECCNTISITLQRKHENLVEGGLAGQQTVPGEE